MFDSLLDFISSSGWTYVVCFALALGDVLFPLLPSETAVITAGVLAATGDLSVALIIACAAIGAIAGDNIAYLLGRTTKGWVRTHVFPGKKARHLDRAERSLLERGGSLIVVGRFVPGGRSAVTFGAGMLAFRWRRFILYDVVAGVAWATYATLIGYFGGKAFENHPGLAILVALSIALAFAGVFESGRWLRRRQRESRARTAAGQTEAP